MLFFVARRSGCGMSFSKPLCSPSKTPRFFDVVFWWQAQYFRGLFVRSPTPTIKKEATKNQGFGLKSCAQVCVSCQRHFWSTPIFAYVIFCRQAQWLRHVVFKTPALTNENPLFFRCHFLMAGAVLQRSLCQKSYAHHRKRGHQKQGGWLEELCAGVGFLSKAFSKFTLGSSWTHLGSSNWEQLFLLFWTCSVYS